MNEYWVIRVVLPNGQSGYYGKPLPHVLPEDVGKRPTPLHGHSSLVDQARDALPFATEAAAKSFADGSGWDSSAARTVVKAPRT